jgi:hypothetical protein
VTEDAGIPPEDNAPQPQPRRPLADLGDGYELEPPADQQSARWRLWHHGRPAGYVERAYTATGRSTRWRAYTPAGAPITAAATAGHDGAYRTKRDALVQVAIQHQITERRRRPQRQRPG